MKIEGDALTSGAALVLTTNDGSKMISSLSSENIEMIANNQGKILVSKTVFDKFHLYDKINLESCNGFKKHAAAVEFMITLKTKNVTKKHSCNVPCKNSNVVSTTTPSAASTTSMAATTTSAPTIFTFGARKQKYKATQ